MPRQNVSVAILILRIIYKKAKHSLQIVKGSKFTNRRNVGYCAFKNTQFTLEISSGSSDWSVGGWVARNLRSMWLPSMAILFMKYFSIGPGFQGHHVIPVGSATAASSHHFRSMIFFRAHRETMDFLLGSTMEMHYITEHYLTSTIFQDQRQSEISLVTRNSVILKRLVICYKLL